MKSNTFNREAERAILDDPRRYAPLVIESAEFLDSPDQADGLLELRWRDKIVPFRFETKARSSPSLFDSVVARLKASKTGGRRARRPLIVVPHISEALSELLMENNMSALDLNGNFLILTPDLLAVRLDRPNAYTESREIKKVYSYNSSIVGRFLLRGPGYPLRVGEIHEEIDRLGGEISLSTVSKVLSALEEDLIIDKSRSTGIELLQPDRLLDNLRNEYRDPRVGAELRLKLPEDEDKRRTLLDDRLRDWMWTGETSAERYSAAAMTQRRTLFTPDTAMRRKLAEFEDDRFYNCVAKQTDDPFVYFGRVDEWASDVEACLALSQLDKRERETADQIARHILERFE